MDWVFSTTN